MKFTLAKEKRSYRVVGKAVGVGSLNNRKSLVDVSWLTGVPVEDLLAAREEHDTKGTTDFTYGDFAPAHHFVTRLITAEDATGKRHETFVKAIKSPACKDRSKSVITWKDRDEACVVDLDWHTDPSKAPTELPRVYPAPSYAWLSGRGVHLVYERQGDTPAECLAVAGLMNVYAILAPENVELKTETRHPPRGFETYDASDIATLDCSIRAEPTLAARDEWLAEKGLVVGQRYAHDSCLIDPSRASTPGGSPVEVCERGVMCYSCGSHSRGWRSYAELLETRVDSRLATCVRSFTHWMHAKYLLRDLVTLPEELHGAYYRAALILEHGASDPRVARVFASHNLLRVKGYWITQSGETRKPKYVEEALRNLPVCQGKDGKPIKSIVQEMMDSVSLDTYGYFPIRRVRGIRIATHHPRIESSDRPIMVIPMDRALGEEPKYLGTNRLSEEVAWTKVERVYTGVNRGLIETLVVCRGYNEIGHSNSPYIFLISGGSGSGKTQSFGLAAMICGDTKQDVNPSLTQGDDKIYGKFLSAAELGGFLVPNEFVKAAKLARLPETLALHTLLHLTPTTAAWKLYTGPVPFGDLPVFGITDIEYTEATLSDSQLGRRCFYVDLGQRENHWKDNCWRELGVSAGMERTDSDFAFALDSLLSHWIDRHFGPNVLLRDVDAIAEELGVMKLNKLSFRDVRAGLMKELFTLWLSCSARSSRKAHTGYKAFPTDPTASPISRVWSELHDAGDPVSWAGANERDWATVLGREGVVRLLVKSLRNDSKSWVQLRFEERHGGTWGDVT